MSKYTQAQIKQRVVEYMELDGMSRHEERVADYLKASLKDANVSYVRDQLGSIIFKHNHAVKGPKILIATHMDEVGYVVQEIFESGQLSISPIGGIWPNVVIGTAAKIIIDEKTTYNGVFGHTSIHVLSPDDRTKAYPNKDLYVDCGFTSKQEAIDAGIKIGTEVCLTGQTLEFKNPDYLVGKAIDNRVSVGILDLLVHALAKQDLVNQTYFAATVQEEVGLRGAKAAVSLIKPDVGIIIDTTASHDTYKCPEGTTKLGSGVAIRINDGGTLVHPGLLEYFESLAAKHNIPCYRYVARGGGTDAAEVQFGPEGGVLTIGFSIPQRYLHSPIGVANMKDVMAAFNLVFEFLKAFDEREFNKIKFK